MGKTKQDDSNKIVKDKQAKKGKQVPEKAPAKDKLTLENEGKANKTSNLNDTSKKIKKEAVQPANIAKAKPQQEVKQKNKANGNKPKQAKKEEEPVKAHIEELDENKFKDFIHSETSKYTRIRRRTIDVLKLDKNQIKKAVQALVSYHNSNKNKKDLLDTGDDFIYLEIVLSEVPKQYSIRPTQIQLPTPIYGPEYQSRFCIFSKDPQREFKDKIQNLNIPCFAKVIGYTKLIKNHPQYNDKRKLIYDFDLFFCDYKLYNLMKKPTGKIFYERKKIPFPIDCEKVPEHLKEHYKSYEDYLNGLSNFTYFSMGNGPVYTVKVARVSLGLKDTVKNIIHGVYNTVPHILKETIKHTKIRSVAIKTATSISLPIFNQLSEEELNAILDKETNGGIEQEVEDDVDDESDE